MGAAEIAVGFVVLLLMLLSAITGLSKDHPKKFDLWAAIHIILLFALAMLFVYLCPSDAHPVTLFLALGIPSYAILRLLALYEESDPKFARRKIFFPLFALSAAQSLLLLPLLYGVDYLHQQHFSNELELMRKGKHPSQVGNIRSRVYYYDDFDFPPVQIPESEAFFQHANLRNTISGDFIRCEDDFWEWKAMYEYFVSEKRKRDRENNL